MSAASIYESVDDKQPILGYISNIDGKKKLILKELNINKFSCSILFL